MLPHPGREHCPWMPSETVSLDGESENTWIAILWRETKCQLSALRTFCDHGHYADGEGEPHCVVDGDGQEGHKHEHMPLAKTFWNDFSFLFNLFFTTSGYILILFFTLRPLYGSCCCHGLVLWSVAIVSRLIQNQIRRVDGIFVHNFICYQPCATWRIGIRLTTTFSWDRFAVLGTCWWWYGRLSVLIWL